MKGLWVYSRYNQRANSRLAADCITNKGPYLEPSSAGSLVDLILAFPHIMEYDIQEHSASSEK